MNDKPSSGTARTLMPATDLRARLDRPNLDAGAQPYLVDALGSVGGRLDADAQLFLIAALGSVGGRLDAADAAKAGRSAGFSELR
jgi:hypothetical protein